jgi:uncharacterized tellurite resistance protein B-like protein
MSLFARLFGTRTPQELEARVIPIIKMMAMDGEKSPKEYVALAAHLQHVGISAERARALLSNIKPGTPVPLPTEPRHKLEVLLGAAAMMVADGDIAVDELGYLHFLAAQMGLPPSVLAEVIERAIALGQSMNPGVDLQSDFEAALAVLALKVSR